MSSGSPSSTATAVSSTVYGGATPIGATTGFPSGGGSFPNTSAYLQTIIVSAAALAVILIVSLSFFYYRRRRLRNMGDGEWPFPTTVDENGRPIRFNGTGAAGGRRGRRRKEEIDYGPKPELWEVEVDFNEKPEMDHLNKVESSDIYQESGSRNGHNGIGSGNGNSFAAIGRAPLSVLSTIFRSPLQPISINQSNSGNAGQQVAGPSARSSSNSWRRRLINSIITSRRSSSANSPQPQSSSSNHPTNISQPANAGPPTFGQELPAFPISSSDQLHVPLQLAYLVAMPRPPLTEAQIQQKKQRSASSVAVDDYGFEEMESLDLPEIAIGITGVALQLDPQDITWRSEPEVPKPQPKPEGPVEALGQINFNRIFTGFPTSERVL